MKRTKKSKIKRKKKINTRRKRRKKNKTKKVYKKTDFKSADGMLTSVWGPSLWHFLHTMSFNYPVKPTNKDKKNYKKFVESLLFVLPCKYCRINFKKNLKQCPLTNKSLMSRANFSRWMFNMHELINKMLKKKSGLKYCDIRERYEHFRSRCTIDLDANNTKIIKIIPKRKTRKKKEKGCVEPLYGKKSKCIIKIVPKDKKIKTFSIDKKCIKKRHK